MKKNRKWILRLGFGVFLLFGSGFLIWYFQKTSSVFPAYRNFSRGFLKILSKITGIVPFALWDFLLVFLCILVILGLIRVIRKKQHLFDYLTRIFLTASVIISIVLGDWMLNYYAPPLSDELGMEIRKYSEDELFEATAYYFDLAASYADLQERDAEGHLISQDFSELSKICGSSYAPLSEENALFNGSTAPVKRLLLYGDFLLMQGYTGIFMPLTGEANVPAHESTLNMPFTMCHEAAHRLGIASEEEANFCAFLACNASQDVRLRYSGYYRAFSYCYNKLYKKNYDRLLELLREKEKDPAYALVLSDASDQREYYKKYENEKVEEISDKVYDTYLKSFSQEDGLQSYGEVVDELIAWMLSEKSGVSGE